MSTATKNELSAMHKAFAAYLMSLIADATRTDDEGNLCGLPLDAATMGAIRAFLKDNDITCDPADRAHLDELRERFSKNAQLGGMLSKALDDVTTLN